MKTACFSTYTGPGRVSIARWAPRGTPAGFRILKALAPRRHMLKMDYWPYREEYFRDILGRLDPQETWDRLHDMAAGNEPVLLCWERPPLTISPDNWCHRQLVALWFQDELGKHVPELERVDGTAPPPSGGT